MSDSYQPRRGDEIAWRLPNGTAGRGIIRKTDADRLTFSVAAAPKADPGMPVQVAIGRPEGLYTFQSLLIAVEPPPRPALVIRAPDEISITQRRKYLRLPIHLRVLGSPIQPPGPPIRGTTSDVSGGGLRASFDVPPLPFVQNARVHVEFTLGDEAPIRSLGRVAHVSPARQGQVEVGLEFVGLPERVRDRIIKYIQDRLVDGRKEEE